MKKFTNLKIVLGAIKFSLLICVLFAGPAYADYALWGHVYSRGVVEEDDGTRYWAEYNTDSGELEGHFTAEDPYALETTLIMSALQYRVYVSRWESIKQEYKDAELLADPGSSGEEHPPLNLSRADLLATTFTVLLPDGTEPVTFQFSAGDLNDDTRHILLRPPVIKDAFDYLPLFNDDNQIDISAIKRHIVLAQMQVNPDEQISEDSLSLLISTQSENMDARVTKESEHNLGLLTSFINGVEGAEEYDGESYTGVKYGIMDSDDRNFTNPIENVVVSSFGGLGYEFFDVTDDNGRYSMFFGGWLGGPPCWINIDSYSPLNIKLSSKSFNPRLRQGYPYYIRLPHYLPCNPAHPLTTMRNLSLASTGLTGAMVAVSLIAMSAASSGFVNRMDYIVDMKVLAGQAEMSNEHLSVHATTDINTFVERRSDVLDQEIQNEWAASGWSKDISVSTTEATEYRVDAPTDSEYKITQSQYDFDGDGKEDSSKIGQFMCVTPAENGGQDTERLVDRNTECEDTEESHFKIDATASSENKIGKQSVDDAGALDPPSPYYQGVYYSSSIAEGEEVKGLPDIVRLLDDVINDYHQGLLKVIAENDLRNTDVYVFRESTGELLAERSGLAYSDLTNQNDTDTANFDVAESNFHYRLQMRGGLEGFFRESYRYGRRDENGNIQNYHEAFERWQTLSGMNPKFHEREADHIRPGEPVKIIAINRATGYIGSAKTMLEVKDSIYTVPSIRVPKIKMGPPNLKIWAERELTVEHGLTQGEKRKYLIGSEGGAETDDIIIKVYSEWLDQDGSPLPEQLKDFGYTARLGKLTGEDTIENYNVTLDADDVASTAGQSVRYFPINPGKNLQLIRVSEADAGTQHLYLQVNGESYLRNPDFSGDPAIDIELNSEDNRDSPEIDFADLGAGQDQLQTRPKHYVPVLTPVWDEDTTLENKLYFKKWEIAREEAEANGGEPDDVNPFKPEAAYKWRYRPEYQFTVYDLKVKEIEKVNYEDDGGEDSEEILLKELPVIGSSDDLIKFIYDLSDQVANPISLFSGDTKELVFALGEEEFKINFGSDQTIALDNIHHLANLDIEDFLTMRLYTNNDVANILWEWAFLSLSVGITSQDKIVGDDVAYISADEPTVGLGALILGYSSLSPEHLSQMPRQVKWSVVSGNASISPVFSDLSNSGVAETTVSLSPQALNNVVVKAELVGDPSAYDTSIAMEVMPGKPSSIALSLSGTAYLKEVGQVDVEGVIRDQHNNLVLSGTPVEFREEGHITLESYTGFTNLGRVSAVVKGGGIVGTYPLALNVGELSEVIDINVSPLSVEILDLPDNLITGRKYNLQARISGGSGTLGNIFLDIGADAGQISSLDTVTSSQGIVNFTYKAPLAPGNYNLGIKLDLNAPHIEPIIVNRPSVDSEIEAQQFYMVSGADGASEVSITNYNDESRTLEILNNNTIVIAGAEGDGWELAFDSLHFLNLDPVYFSRFSSVRWDELRKYDSSFNGVSRGRSLLDGIYSLVFSSSDGEEAAWNLLYHQDFELLEPSYNFWFEAVADGQVLSVANESINLDYSNGSLIASVITENGNYQLSVDGLVDETWLKVAVGVRNGNFYLAVDEQLESIPLDGFPIQYSSISEGDSWLSLGGGFTGKLAGLRIYNNQQEELITFSNLSGIFDSSGEDSIEISLSDTYAQQSVQIPGVTVALKRETGESTKINVLNNQVVSDLASNYFDINSDQHADTSTIMQSLPMSENFPDPRLAVSTLSQRMVLRGNQDVAVENVIANISWLSYEPRYAVLHDKVKRLKRIFADQNQAQLAHYAAEYLQEAIIQASNGDPVWIRSMSTGLTVLAELAEIRPEHIPLVGNAIKNRKDFWTWIRVLGLPANAWAGETIPIPRPEITCDLVNVDVNEGTLYEFSATPCRASGAQMGAFIDVFLDVEPLIEDNPELLTTYVTTLLSGLPQTSVAFRRLFPPHNAIDVVANDSLIIQDAHAVPIWLAYAVRAMAIAIKQSIRKAAGGAPANFVAFMQGGTTSRVTRWEMLATLAYLGSRLDSVDLCDEEGCKKLRVQVSKTVIQDMASWFSGLGLAKNGEITDGGLMRRSCQVSNNAHGKGFELLATAAYHALYEFGASVGLNAAEYEILLSDPKDNKTKIEVAIMHKTRWWGIDDYDGSPHQRKPDLVLFGEGPRKRHWVELKSWRFSKKNPKYLNKDEKSLNKRIFTAWNGKNKDKAGNTKGKLNFRAHAHRQFFLDHVASADTLVAEHWKGKSYELDKPNKHTTWIQIWKSGVREWKKLEKVNGKYRLGKKVPTINVATPWIDEDKIVTSIPPQFRALQGFLAQAPGKISNSAFLQSVGYSKAQHQSYVDKQITENFTQLSESDIKPFNLMTFLALETGGAEGAKQMFKKLVDGFVGEEYGELLAKVEAGEISEEVIEQLQENITGKMLEILGPIKWVFFKIPIISDIEDSAADYLLGNEIEELRKIAAEKELSSYWFENACEAP